MKQAAEVIAEYHTLFLNLVLAIVGYWDSI